MSPRAPHAVIVTAWNRRDFIADALESVLRCSDPPEELVVVANYRDETLEQRLVRRGGRWVVCDIDCFGAATAAGLNATTSPVVSFLDDDDIYFPLRVTAARKAFDADSGLGLLHFGYIPFARDPPPPQREGARSSAAFTVPPGDRSKSSFLSLWREDVAYNGSSVSVRRELLAPHLAELRSIRLAVPPYLFFRAWASAWGLRSDPAFLVAVRQHPGSSTTGRFEARSVRLPRLRRIGPALSQDAARIRSILPAGTWDLALGEIISMATIFESIDRPTVRRRDLARAALDLVLEWRVWVPRATLLLLASSRALSASSAAAMYRLLTSSRPGADGDVSPRSGTPMRRE